MIPGESPIERARRWFYMKPVALRTLLAINASVYVLIVVGSLLTQGVLRDRFMILFALNQDVVQALTFAWQFVTYNFVHLEAGFWGFLHITFNLLWLVWIGQEYEEFYGARQTTLIYIVSGVVGGVLTVLLHTLFPGAEAFNQPVYGATAAVIGVVSAAVGRDPDKRIGLLFIGVVPLRYALIGFLILDVVFGTQGQTFFAAHVGAALFGYLYARTQQEGVQVGTWRPGSGREPRRETPTATATEEGRSFLQRLENWLGSKSEGTGEAPPRPKRRRRSSAPDPARNAQDAQQEIDRILDKISESGYDSLTETEKRTLLEASRD